MRTWEGNRHSIRKYRWEDSITIAKHHREVMSLLLIKVFEIFCYLNLIDTRFASGYRLAFETTILRNSLRRFMKHHLPTSRIYDRRCKCDAKSCYKNRSDARKVALYEHINERAARQQARRFQMHLWKPWNYIKIREVLWLRLKPESDSN